MKTATSFSRRLLNWGFAFALVLSALCLITSAAYLFVFLFSTNSSIELILRDGKANNTPQDIVELAIYSKMALTRITFLSCGVFVGMSFGFLGFALFLMGIKEEMDVSASSDTYQLKVARMSPGAFMILAATILIGFCIARQMPFSYQYSRLDPSEAPINTQPTPSPKVPSTAGGIKP